MQERTTSASPDLASATQTKPASRSKAADSSHGGSVKETVESILVAFILAFVFRAFVVEAFVIPTGSMAPTLLGAHMRFRCHDCGFAFTSTYNASDDPDGSNDLRIPPVAREQYQVFCPNCGFKVPSTESRNVPLHYGDRILVLKYAYLFNEPKRWDVVVFKSPDAVRGADLYETNYIKRLVGRPGESIMVLDGDVYVGPAQAQQATDFQIQDKPRYAQDALWRVVYDNDYQPLGRNRSASTSWVQPWTQSEGSGWDLGGFAPAEGAPPTSPARRTFQFSNATGLGTLTFNKDANPDQHSLTDWLAYDRDLGGLWPVSDLKLDCYYHRTAGDGPLRMILSKLDDIFIAEITPSQARIIRRRADGTEKAIGSVVTVPDASKKPVHVEFENVDYRVTLRVDGKDVIQSTREEYHPDQVQLLANFNSNQRSPFPTVSLQAESQTCELSHVGLWRDVYYLNGGMNNRFWASPVSFPERVMRLKENEYFVLGDNSQISGDARMWQEGIDLPHEDLFVDAGRVPKRFLLGKAFFVYWPAGYKPADFSPALVPNVGDMRFIH